MYKGTFLSGTVTFNLHSVGGAAIFGLHATMEAESNLTAVLKTVNELVLVSNHVCVCVCELFKLVLKFCCRKRGPYQLQGKEVSL